MCERLQLAKLQNDLANPSRRRLPVWPQDRDSTQSPPRSWFLTLDDFAGVFLAQQIADDLARFGGVGRPVNRASGGGAALFKLFQVSAQILQRMRAGAPRLLCATPASRSFQPTSLARCLNHVRWRGHVFAAVAVAQHRQDGLWEGKRLERIEFGVGACCCVGS